MIIQVNKQNMKKLFFSLLCFAICLSTSGQQTFQDVVYLKNGSIIRGKIIEMISNISIKLENPEKTVFFFKMDVIEKITKEPVLNTGYPSNTGYSGNSSNSNYNTQPSNNNYNTQPSNNNYNARPQKINYNAQPLYYNSNSRSNSNSYIT